jgi:hypothetical protein
MRVDAIRKPTARAPIQEAVNAIRIRLKGLLIGNAIGVKDPGERRVDYAGGSWKAGEATAVPPVFGTALKEKMVEEIRGGMFVFPRLFHYGRWLEYCVPGRLHVGLGVQGIWG